MVGVGAEPVGLITSARMVWMSGLMAARLASGWMNSVKT